MAVEFGTFAVEFVALALQFVTLAIELHVEAFVIELGAFALEFVTFALGFVIALITAKKLTTCHEVNDFCQGGCHFGQLKVTEASFTCCLLS